MQNMISVGMLESRLQTRIIQLQRKAITHYIQPHFGAKVKVLARWFCRQAMISGQKLQSSEGVISVSEVCAQMGKGVCYKVQRCWGACRGPASRTNLAVPLNLAASWANPGLIPPGQTGAMRDCACGEPRCMNIVPSKELFSTHTWIIE